MECNQYKKWNPPKGDYIKISIHYVKVENPVQNGKINGVGILVRNFSGKMLRGDMGPMQGMYEGQSLFQDMHAGAVQALKMDKHLVQIDMENRDIFDILRP